MSARLIMKLRVAQAADVAHGVRQYVLRHTWRDELPAWAPGAHVDVRLPDGRTRQYSLCGDPLARGEYRISVKRDEAGRGGSRWIHENVRTGDVLHVSAPRNNFPLADSARRHVFVAGGIGITPLAAMVRAAKRAGTPFVLHYCARSAAEAPLLAELDSLCAKGELVRWFRAPGTPGRFDPAALGALEPGTHAYCCGPSTLVATVRHAISGSPGVELHAEAFAPPVDESFKPEPFDIVIHSSGERLRVPAGESALDVLRARGMALTSSCERGVCGACECGYRDGTVIHRDVILPLAARQDRMMLCVSRARVSVTLDL